MKAKIRNALVTWNNPPTKDWDELVAMLSPAYMVGQLERAGRQGRSIGSSLSSGRTLGPLPQSRRTCPSLTLRRVRAGPPHLTARRPTPGTQDLGSLAQGLRAAQARHRPRTGRLGTSSPPRASSRKFRQNSNQAPGQFGAHSPPESQIHRPNRCARSLDWGAPGVGKSHFARQVLGAEGYYPKLNNKWWDGYQSQKVVIMEDVDKETVKFLHHHLKIWADRWGSLARPRGRGCPHSPMAGSNFQLQHHGHPQGPRGPPAQEAITRRFMRFEMLSRDEIKNWDTYETVTPEAVAAIFK